MKTIKYPLLLDGGLSNQLESQGCNLNQSLWTAAMIKSNPEAIIEAHLAYLEAGADCIITSSYQATISGFAKLGIDSKEAESLILKSVELAIRAKNIFLERNPDKAPALVAASIGPYGAYLADGSEYRGNYGISDKDLKDFHSSRIELLDTSEADMLACETIPSYQEARLLAELLLNCNKKSWMTFSCKDGIHINDGTPIVECMQLLNRHPAIFALGVNCTKPSYISSLMKIIKATCGGKKIVVYPNSGEIYNANTKTWAYSSESSFSVQSVREWLELGADIVGGCCRVGPAQIHEVKLNVLNIMNT